MNSRYDNFHGIGRLVESIKRCQLRQAPRAQETSAMDRHYSCRSGEGRHPRDLIYMAKKYHLMIPFRF
jgi:hypothetical protein